MDILRYKPIDTIDVAINDPYGNATDIVITVAGVHTARWRNGLSSYDRDADATGSRLLAMATVSWQNVAEDGQPVEATTDNVERVYLNYPWIRDQVDLALGDKKRFFPNAANP